MKKENNLHFHIVFTEEFHLCLNRNKEFFAEQGEDTLNWWYSREDEILNYIESLLSSNPNIWKSVKNGDFKGLRRRIYGKSRHTILNYIIYYAIHENQNHIDVINIVPSRTKRLRIKG